MKFTFEIAKEVSVIGAISTVAVAAIAFTVIFLSSESRPASLAAVVTISAVAYGFFNAVRRKQLTKWPASKLSLSRPLRHVDVVSASQDRRKQCWAV